jgi:hypothetical protein
MVRTLEMKLLRTLGGYARCGHKYNEISRQLSMLGILSETTGDNKKKGYDHSSGIDLKGSWNI